MKRMPLILLLTFSLTLAPSLTGQVEANKGRSYSSGRTSSSRSSSPSFHSSSSARSSGRSYSSGSSSTSKGWSASSFSTSSSVRKPSSPTFDSAAAAAKRRQESKGSFDARSKQPSGGYSSQGRSYSAGSPGGRSYSIGRSQPSQPAKRSSSGSFDSSAAAAQRKQESKTAFTLGTKPRTTYTTSDGKSHPLDAGDKRVEEIRRDIDPGRWATREQRRRTVFPNPPPRPVVIYQDPFSNWFWWWLLAQDLNTRSLWAYHHQSDMDAARYRDLLAKDAQLEKRIHELEAKKEPRDPTYAPPGLDRDLMYDDGFVDAAINPQPPPPPSHSHGLARTVWRIVLVLAAMAFFVWLVFIKRWGGD
jgi:anti-sigma28 factor (negative regulator of flagellin synthesis)